VVCVSVCVCVYMHVCVCVSQHGGSVEVALAAAVSVASVQRHLTTCIYHSLIERERERDRGERGGGQSVGEEGIGR